MGGLRGCGPVQPEYRSIHAIHPTDLEWRTNKPPSDAARVVVVGPQRPKLTYLKFTYFGKDGKEVDVPVIP